MSRAEKPWPRGLGGATGAGQPKGGVMKARLRFVGFLAAMALAAVSLACSASNAAPAAPTAAAAAQQVPGVVPTAQSTATTQSSIAADPVARGEQIFQKTAGGIGCQFCHGTDAKGNIGPDIRGAPVDRITNALASVEAMSFIMPSTPLSRDDIQGISAYLATLAQGP